MAVGAVWAEGHRVYAALKDARNETERTLAELVTPKSECTKKMRNAYVFLNGKINNIYYYYDMVQVPEGLSPADREIFKKLLNVREDFEARDRIADTLARKIGYVQAINSYVPYVSTILDIGIPAAITFGAASAASLACAGAQAGICAVGGSIGSYVKTAGYASSVLMAGGKMLADEKFNEELALFLHRVESEAADLPVEDIRAKIESFTAGACSKSKLFEEILFLAFSKRPKMPHGEDMSGAQLLYRAQVQSFVSVISQSLTTADESGKSMLSVLFALMKDTNMQDDVLSAVKKLKSADIKLSPLHEILLNLNRIDARFMKNIDAILRTLEARPFSVACRLVSESCSSVREAIRVDHTKLSDDASAIQKKIKSEKDLPLEKACGVSSLLQEQLKLVARQEQLKNISGAFNKLELGEKIVIDDALASLKKDMLSKLSTCVGLALKRTHAPLLTKLKELHQAMPEAELKPFREQIAALKAQTKALFPLSISPDLNASLEGSFKKMEDELNSKQQTLVGAIWAGLGSLRRPAGKSAEEAAGAAAVEAGQRTSRSLFSFLKMIGFDYSKIVDKPAAAASESAVALEMTMLSRVLKEINGNEALREKIASHSSLQPKHGAAGKGPAAMFLQLVEEVVESGDYTAANPRVKTLQARLSQMMNLLDPLRHSLNSWI